MDACSWFLLLAKGSTTSSVKMKRYLLSFFLVFAIGCASLNPGADALVVRVEQSEAVALSTFDLVLGIDHAQRDWFARNVPEFHKFCEWLRAPVAVDGTNTLPHSLALVKNLDNVKIAYKQGAASSNAVTIALAVLQSSVKQANGWITTVSTNK